MKSKKFVFKSDEEYRLSQVNPYKNRVEQVQGFEQEEKELKDVKVEGRLDILEKPKKCYELKSKTHIMIQMYNNFPTERIEIITF